MQRALQVSAATAVAWFALLGALASPAGATIDYGPCPKTNQYACAQLVVPLDPTGATPGTVTLAIRRHRAAFGDASTAIVALAGGPGQAAIPFAEEFAELLGPIADTRDLIVFDQRGTGTSQPLSCHVGHPQQLTLEQAVSRCAASLGRGGPFTRAPTRLPTSRRSARPAATKSSFLYGTSYGTKVAEEYAQAHPGQVEALVLDSVVSPDGPDTLNRPTFAALPRVLRQICAGGVCRGVTPDPWADLTRLLRRIHSRALVAHARDAGGHVKKVPITAQGLLEILLAGDFSGRLRAEFVTDVRAAALGDTAPLARTLEMLSEAGGESSEEFNGPLYYATTCEEQAFPWQRTSSPAIRLREAEAAAHALPASTFAPFSAADAIGLSDIPACSAWPYPATPAPVQNQPLPAVPTLILSGADDLRTPTANAREVAATIPGAHLLVVPFTGHSVLGEDPSTCSGDALQALFKGEPIKPCRAGRPPQRLRPQPPPPRSLTALKPAAGYSGQTGRTARGIALTVADLARQFALQSEVTGAGGELFASPSQGVGGLRAGWASVAGSTLTLHDYSEIPGLTLSGTIRPETIDLRIGGTAAATGTLRRGTRRSLVGTLGGQAVRLPADSVISAAIVGIDAATREESDPRRLGSARPGLVRLRLGRGGTELPALP